MAKSIKSFGTLVIKDLFGREKRRLSLDVAMEYVAPWQKGSKDKGFPSLFDALATASQTTKVVVIVRVRGSEPFGPDTPAYLGTFRVFQTSLDGPNVPRLFIQEYVPPTGKKTIPKELSETPRFVNVHARRHSHKLANVSLMRLPTISATPIAWKDRVKELKKAGKMPEGERLALEMLVDFCSLTQSEFHGLGADSHSIRYGKEIDGRKVLRPNVVNFNWLSPDTVDFLGITSGYLMDKYCRERSSTQRPVVAIMLPKKGVARHDPLDVLLTLGHEAVHASDFHRVLQLIDIWRSSTRKGNFMKWSVDQFKLNRKPKLSERDLARIVDHCGRVVHQGDRWPSWDWQFIRPIAIKVGFVDSVSMHLFPHLHGLKMRLWLVGPSTVLSKYKAWEKIQSPGKEKEFTQFRDLDSMDKYFGSTGRYKLMNKFAKEAIADLSKLVRRAPFSSLKEPMKNYATKRAPVLRKQSKQTRVHGSNRGEFLDLLAKEL